MPGKKFEQIESKYAALLDRKDKFETDDRTEVRTAFKNIINNLIEFEIEIAGGEVSIQSGKTRSSTAALLKRIGKKTGRKEQANSCVNHVTAFMKDYRNIAAHADCKGRGKQELNRSDIKKMTAQYELVLIGESRHLLPKVPAILGSPKPMLWIVTIIFPAGVMQ